MVLFWESYQSLGIFLRESLGKLRIRLDTLTMFQRLSMYPWLFFFDLIPQRFFLFVYRNRTSHLQYLFQFHLRLVTRKTSRSRLTLSIRRRNAGLKSHPFYTNPLLIYSPKSMISIPSQYKLLPTFQHVPHMMKSDSHFSYSFPCATYDFEPHLNVVTLVQCGKLRISPWFHFFLLLTSHLHPEINFRSL